MFCYYRTEWIRQNNFIQKNFENIYCEANIIDFESSSILEQKRDRTDQLFNAQVILIDEITMV